jgi:hypothetical protein
MKKIAVIPNKTLKYFSNELEKNKIIDKSLL